MTTAASQTYMATNPFGWELPWLSVFFLLWALVFFRSYVIYWVGRGVLVGASKMFNKVHRVIESKQFTKAQRLVAKYGPPVVSFCFLTVGFQTAVLLSAGVGKMPHRKFAPALLVGGIFWALIYSTVGMLGFQLIAQLWRKSPGLTLGGICAIILLLVGYFLIKKRVLASKQTSQLITEAKSCQAS